MSPEVAQYLVRGVLKPSVRGFVYGYVYVVLPRLLKVIGKARREKQLKSQLWQRIKRVLVRACHPAKFPMFVARFVAGIRLLQPLIASVYPSSSPFTSTFGAALILGLVNFGSYQRHVLRFLSLDFTLIVATRAFDTAFLQMCYLVVPAAVGDGLLFVLACLFIMYAWFFEPQTLPPSYRNWITAAANMDSEIVRILKAFRDRKAEYGTPEPTHLQMMYDYCTRYGQAPERGDFVVTQPIECETVHAFKCKSCELHALWRFQRGFLFALKVYGPLNAVMWLIRRGLVLRAVVSTARSLAFLGAFIGLYWYAVCLTRTRLAPQLFPNVDRRKWDVTYAPTAGAMLCGFSGFIETAARRKELALFVTPRALGTLVATDCKCRKHLMMENVCFSVLMAVLAAYLGVYPKRVRGLFGKGLARVLN